MSMRDDFMDSEILDQGIADGVARIDLLCFNMYNVIFESDTTQMALVIARVRHAAAVDIQNDPCLSLQQPPSRKHSTVRHK